MLFVLQTAVNEELRETLSYLIVLLKIKPRSLPTTCVPCV